MGETLAKVVANVGEHFAPLLAAGTVELDDVEAGAALDDLLRSVGLEPRLAAPFADITRPALELDALAAKARLARDADLGSTDPSLTAVTEAPAQLLVRAARLEIAEGELGQGALGRVRAARFGELGRTVAVKQWKPLQQHLPWLTPQELSRRVLIEARAQSQLNHPCVMPVLDVQTRTSGEGPVLVMPLAAGGSLRARLAQQMPLAQALRAAAQISNALAQAHAASVVHTAIKPENVMFDARGNALLSDFGTARLVAPPPPTSGERAPRISVDLGDAAYRAPEASHGKDLEAPADAFSFGVLLYEMLTRQLPGRRSPVPSLVRPEVSREIDDLVDALLEDDPTRRPTLATAAAKLSLALGGNPLYLLP